MPFVAHGVENPNSKRSYITTSAFNAVIYSYATQVNAANGYKVEGKLTAITTLPSGAAVTATNCPAGRILREVGRKLYPGANPGLAVGDTYSGAVVGTTVTNHMWVSVFDSVTGLRGFIDPNASQFAVYSTDRNPAFVDAAETAGGTPTRLGPSIYTSGNVTAVGNVVAGGQLTLTGTTKVITYAATDSSYSFSANLGPFYSFAAAAAVNLNATTVPPTGTTLTIFYSGPYLITPNTKFVGATVTPILTGCIAVSYVSNGTVLIEYARSGALPSTPTFP